MDGGSQMPEASEWTGCLLRGCLGEGAADAVEDRHDEQRDHGGLGDLLPWAGRDAEAEEQRGEAEEEGAVAFAHRAVVAAGGADLDGDDAGHLGEDREDDDEDDLERVEAGDEGEGEVERGVGDDVADFVEDGAEAGLLTVLASEHAVDGIERHADEKKGGDDEERPAGEGLPGDAGAGGDGEERGENGDLVGGDAGVEEGARERAEEVLEGGLDVVDRGHGRMAKG